MSFHVGAHSAATAFLQKSSVRAFASVPPCRDPASRPLEGGEPSFVLRTMQASQHREQQGAIQQRTAQQSQPRVANSRTFHCRRLQNRPTSQHYYSFSLINKELNNIARDHPERQSILIKSYIRLVFEKATEAKADLIGLERWAHLLRKYELESVCQSVAMLNSTLRAFAAIIALESSPQPEQKIGKLPGMKESSTVGRQLQELLAKFKSCYLQIVHISNKHLYSSANFPQLSREAFGRLLESSMKVRYLLGLVHKEIERLEQHQLRHTEFRSSSENPRKKRIADMSRALKKKYNMENDRESQKWANPKQQSAAHDF